MLCHRSKRRKQSFSLSIDYCTIHPTCVCRFDGGLVDGVDGKWIGFVALHNNCSTVVSYPMFFLLLLLFIFYDRFLLSRQAARHEKSTRTGRVHKVYFFHTLHVRLPVTVAIYDSIGSYLFSRKTGSCVEEW